MSEQLLKDLYYNLSSPASFSGINSLYQSAKKINPNIKKAEVRKFLLAQNIYLRHRRPRKPRSHAQRFSKFVTTGPRLNFSCDSAYFPYSTLPYVIVCRDAFSGKVYAKSQRGLKSLTTLKTIQKLIEEQAQGKFPATIYTDLGHEYALLHQLPSHHKLTHGRNQKSFIAEQTIAAIRNKVNKYSTFSGRKVDISSVLPSILHSINTTANSRTGLTPEQSELLQNAGIVFQRKYGKYMEEKQNAEQRNKFKLGDFVRVSIPDTANQFLKRSLPGFSVEVFQVKSVRDTLPHTYIVQDSIGRQVAGYFNESHLLSAEPNYENWRLIDKVIQSRSPLSTSGQSGGEEEEKEYLVTFKGYPSDYKVWLNQETFDLLIKPFPERVL